jgi:hypothetical protein
MVQAPLELVALDVFRPARKARPDERFVVAGRPGEGARD